MLITPSLMGSIGLQIKWGHCVVFLDQGGYSGIHNVHCTSTCTLVYDGEVRCPFLALNFWVEKFWQGLFRVMKNVSL